jgi:hypothetical protein
VPGDTGTIQWAGGALPVEKTFSFPQGFFEVNFPELNQSFGVVSLPEFTTRHPEGRDAAFSIDAAMTQGIGVGDRPSMTTYASQLISSLGRVGLAAARERQCTGVAMAANGTMGDWPALNVAVRAEWAAAGVGVVDLCYADDAWMGSQPGASGPGPPGWLSALSISTVNQFGMAVLYVCAGCLTSENGGFRPGQW